MRDVTDLERDLVELGRLLEYPPAPDPRPAVRSRLAAPPARRWLPTRRAIAIAFAVCAVTVGVAFAVPPARTAILEWLGLKGVAVVRVGTLPKAQVGQSLDLGERVTLAEARRRAAYPVLVPGAAEAGRPDEVYYREPPPGGQVALVYRSPTAAARVRLLLTEFRGEALPFVQKSIGPGTRAEPVTVNGEPGIWLEGAPHLFVYRDATGEILQESLRLAGNTLLWEQGSLTLRIEGPLTKREALRIARSVR